MRPGRAVKSWCSGAGSSTSARIASWDWTRIPGVQRPIRLGLRKWGSHNGSSRAFASVRANVDAEQRLAGWLGVESVLIYPSVMLANLGAIPGLTGRHDAIALDEMAHSSMQEAAKIARANGTKVATFAHSDPQPSNRLSQACALPLRSGVYRRRIQHERQDPAHGRARCGRPGRLGRAVHR